jgi:hypothetical protein
MAIFVITVTQNPDAAGRAVVEQYGASHLQLSPNTWFVSDSGTTKEVADKIGMTSGTDAAVQGAVLKVSAYSGRATASVWNWLQARGEALPNA